MLQTVIRQVALHSAAKEKLKAVFRIEGSVFTNLAVRNLHVAPTGPGIVESIDVDFARAEYSLLGLLRHRSFLHDVEVRSARVVLNPAKALAKARPKKTASKPELPGIFPDRVHLSDVTLIIRGKPHDLVIEHLDLSLDPRNPGELRIQNLQLPTSQSWSKISAKTSYANRSLILRDLALTDADRIRDLEIDASAIDAKKLSLKLDAALGGGTLSGSAVLSETSTSLNTKVHLMAENIAADSLNKYATLPENFLGGGIEQVILDGTGLLDVPKTWNGTVAARLNGFHAGALVFDRCVLDIVAANGTATLKSGEILQGTNEFHLQGTSNLPPDVRELGRSPTTLEIAAKAPDLRPVTKPTGREIAGSAEATGKINIENGKLEADLSAAAGPLTFAGGSIKKVTFDVQASKKFGALNSESPWFTNFQSTTNLNVSELHYRDYMVDSIVGAAVGAGESLKFEQLSIRRGQNEITAQGSYQLPADFTKVSKTGSVELSLNAPEVGDFWVSDSPDKWTGPLQANGRVEWRDGVANGEISLFGANVRARDLVINEVSGQSIVVNNTVYLNDFTSRLDENDFVSGNGIIDFSRRLKYTGKLTANISDLSRLKPVLHAGGNNNDLAGSLSIEWQGSGDAAKVQNGKLKLTLQNGRYGTLKSLQANIDANYSPDGLEIPTVFLRSERMDFQAIVQAKGQTLEVTKIQLDQGQAKYASGYLSLPFVWKNLGTDAPLFPNNGKVLATFESSNIDIKKLFEDFGMAPLFSGVMNAKAQATGTLANLDARFDLEMRDLRNEKFPRLEPATFNLTASAGQGQLSINGKLQQAKIQPAELTAKMPLDLPKILRQKQLPDETPVTANVRLPRSSVNFIRQFVPPVQELDGDMGIDVSVNGTIGRPILKGSADMTINVARTVDPTFPALQGFKARLNFADNALTFDQFGGELSGGHFTVTGKVTFPKLTQPNLDLQLRADSALISRNDTLTARADADVRCSGPLTSASVTGNVAITNSHILKNLDLIPIGLPGRPAPQPPAARPELSFPDPPLRDWKFDVAIKTKDPVLLRGSLASGGATVDLHFSGTGLHPELQGMVRLENVEATLPFSRLEISNGFLYFEPSDPLNPKIDLHGTSVLHDHTIQVYIYGTILAPQAVFNSEPPLPQEDIISLLATGTTREELTGNNNVIAGRAAMLLVQQLYRKVFKKGEATQSNSVFDRLDLDVGTVDPRTGQQQAVARFKINDQFVVVGDVGVGGDYRGMVKYLIRFH